MLLRKRGGAISFGCPYEAKSTEAGELLTSVDKNFTDLISNLKEEGKDCNLSTHEMETNLSSINSALNVLSKNQYPEQKNMGSKLKVGDSSFSCSATHAPLYSFITTYIQDRIIQVASSDKIEAGISGDLGVIIESAIDECFESLNTRVIIGDAYKNCINKKLKFDPTKPNNPASPIDTFYRMECIGDSSKAFDENFLNQAKTIEEKRTLFEQTMNTIATTSAKVTSSLFGDDEKKCAELKSRMQTVIQQGINLAGNLAGPWGMLAGPSLSSLVNLSVGLIGTNQREVKKLEKIQGEFESNDFRNRFSCNIFHANKLKCEIFNRASLLQNSEDCSEIADGKGIREIISLGKSLREKESKLDADKLTPEQAEELYKKIFENKVNLGGEDKTPYDFLFSRKNGIITTALEYQNDLGPAKQTPSEKLMVLEMKKLKDDLDGFKKEYRATEVGEYPSGARAAQNIMSGHYNHAMLNYMNILTGNVPATDKSHLPSSISELLEETKVKKPSSGLQSKSGLIHGALAEEMSEQMVNQAMDTLSSLIPNDYNVTADLSSTLDKFYDQFLIKDHIRKDYILDPTLVNLKKLAKDLNQSASYDSMGKLKDASTQFSTRLFPMFRDCLMNYQAGLEPQKDGSYSMNKDFKESCSFLKACTGGNNTLGLPFDLNATAQGNPKAANAEDFKACSVANNFDVLSNKFKEEVVGKNSICGLPIKEAVRDLPIK